MNRAKPAEKIFYAKLGARLSQMRKFRRLGKSGLSRAVGVHRNTLDRWESNMQSVPLWGLMRIADCFGCTLLALLPDEADAWMGKPKPAPRHVPAVTYAATNYAKKPVPSAAQAERDPWIHSAGEKRRG